MLAQPTKRYKLDSTIRLWTFVNLGFVARALQVLIEPRERPKRLVAQEALVPRSIPREIGRPCRFLRRRLFPTQGPGEQSRAVRDIVLRVLADDKPIQLFSRHARWAGVRLEVECERPE